MKLPSFILFFLILASISLAQVSDTSYLSETYFEITEKSSVEPAFIRIDKQRGDTVYSKTYFLYNNQVSVEGKYYKPDS